MKHFILTAIAITVYRVRPLSSHSYRTSLWHSKCPRFGSVCKSLHQVLYGALFPRRDVFPLVPPPSEITRRVKEARVHKKLAPEL